LLKLETFQGASAFYTWLYRIAFNVAVTHKRRRKAAISLQQAHQASGQELPDDGEAPTERLERAERRRQVRQALATLGEEFRAVLVLREIDGCCYETIAEILDLPVGTVRSRLHRARSQLRGQLKEVLMIEE
jgi:RNA polymerase sigma-70 factor, ECF subfamily